MRDDIGRRVVGGGFKHIQLMVCQQARLQADGAVDPSDMVMVRRHENILKESRNIGVYGGAAVAQQVRFDAKACLYRALEGGLLQLLPQALDAQAVQFEAVAMVGDADTGQPRLFGGVQNRLEGHIAVGAWGVAGVYMVVGG